MTIRLLTLALLLLGSCVSVFAQETGSPAPFELTRQSRIAESDEIIELRQRVARLEEVLGDGVYSGSIIDPASFTFGAKETCGSLSQPHRNLYPTVKLSGFLQFDSVWFGESAATMAAFGDIADSTAVRRARVAVSGEADAGISYKLDVDFAASGHPSFRDMFVEFKEQPVAENLRVGFFKAPFQLDALTSSRNFTFAERAPFFTFAPFRQIGVGANGNAASEMATWAIAGFRSGTDGFARAQSDDGYGLAARGTILPWYEDEGCSLFHFGFGYSHIQPSGKSIAYDAKLGFFVDEEPGGSSSSVPAFVDTGAIPTEQINLLNVEVAGALDSFHYQGELSYSRVEQTGGSPLSFYGGYGHIGWFVTGESRPYDRKTGVFRSVDPIHTVGEGGPGAWELALRGTFLNLNDENIQGGRMNSVEVVVNWYLCRNLSLKFDYARGFITHSGAADADLDIFGTRIQAIY